MRSFRAVISRRTSFGGVALAGGGVAACYWAAGVGGLVFAIPPGNATVVWPASGIALAAVMLLGYRIWPAVWIGSLLVNLTVSASPVPAAAFATGNTLAALLAAFLLRRWLPSPPFQGARDACVLFFAACLSCIPAAGVGAGTMLWAERIPYSEFSANWWTWWVGDVGGQVIIAPLLLAWAGKRWTTASFARLAELAVAFLLLVVLSIWIFGGLLPEREAERILYLPMVLLIWACVRFDLLEVTAGTVVFSAAAIWGTSHGVGAFGSAGLHESLFDLQLLLITYALTALALNGLVTGGRAARDSSAQSQQALRRKTTERDNAEKWFRQLLTATPDALLVSNAEGEIQLVNEAAERLFGYARDELLGQPIETIVPASHREKHREHRRRYALAPHVRLMGSGIEFVACRKDGSEFPAEIALGPMQTEDGLVVFSAVRDISQRKRLERSLVEKDAELLAAAEIQASLLPNAPPEIPGFDVAGHCYPAEFAAGDHFDYHSPPDGSHVLMLGDVSGHGVGPAILTACFHARFLALAETTGDLQKIAIVLNSRLYRETAGELFITMIAARIDALERTVTCVNAGHPAGIVLNAAGEMKTRFESTGLPLAVLPEAAFRASDPVVLVDGDLVFFYTDGLTEAFRPGRPMFGIDRALAVVSEHRRKPAAEIIEALYQAVRDYLDGGKPQDDVTIVLVKVGPTRSGTSEESCPPSLQERNAASGQTTGDGNGWTAVDGAAPRPYHDATG